ncbi:MAG: response regulator transcription factor [Halanaeroarchaeum sp.]
MTPADETVDDERPTVLVVDDASDLADLYAAWLSDTYDVLVAYDGASAIDAIDESIDVILLDRCMPDLSGDDVLEHVREVATHCRVAMVTAVEPDVDIVDMGFDDYLQKPVDREELHEIVEGLLNRSTYDQRVQDLFVAIRKRSLLDDQLSNHEQSTSTEYRELLERIESLREDLDEAVSELRDEDFQRLFRDLDR